MGFVYSTYFGLARVSNTGPEAKNWAVTDYNPEVTSKLLYALSRHTHSSATPMRFPGYNYATPTATPTEAVLSEIASTPTGVLAPGTTVGVRFSYIDAFDLETSATTEQRITLGTSTAVADAPEVSTPQATPVPNALAGGVYVYGITKVKNTTETELSAVTVAEVPFSQAAGESHIVRLNFDPVADYTDGTTQLNLYRATGLNSQFQLMKSWTTTGVATQAESYVDSGTIENSTQSPPVVTTFDRNKTIQINTRSFSHPADASKFRVYLTQTPGVYGNDHLLEEVDLTTPTGPNPSTPVKNTFHFLGTETLQPDYPKDFTQIITPPGKINLGTETYGGPVLTAPTDFGGYASARFVLPRGIQNAASTPGAMYYDTTSTSVKFNLNNSWVTLTTPTGSFVHSANESGGHSSDRIYFSKGTEGYNVSEVLSIIATPVAASPITPPPRPTLMRKVVQPIYRSDVQTSNVSTNSSSLTSLLSIPNSSLPIKPQFAGQWLEIIFTGSFLIDPQGSSQATASFQLELDGSLVQGEQTYRSATAPATPIHVPVHIYYATPISSSVSQEGLGTLRVMWLTTNGTVTALAKRSTLYAKLLF